MKTNNTIKQRETIIGFATTARAPRSRFNLFYAIFALVFVCALFGNANFAQAELVLQQPSGTVENGGPLRFVWTSSLTASSYMIYAAEIDAAGNTTRLVVETRVAGNVTEAVIPALGEGRYSWQVISFNASGGLMEISSKVDFNIFVTQTPSGLNPASGAAFAQGSEITFKWQGNGKLGYYFEIESLNEKNLVNDIQYTRKLDMAPGVYRWRVGALRSSGLYTLYSPYQEFQVVPTDYVTGKLTVVYQIQNESWTSVLMVSNPTFLQGYARLTFYDRNGKLCGSLFRNVSPYGSMMIRIADQQLAEQPADGVLSVTLESNVPDIKVSGAYVSLRPETVGDFILLPALAPSQELVVPRLLLTNGYSSYIVLRDVSGEPGDITIELYADGAKLVNMIYPTEGNGLLSLSMMEVTHTIPQDKMERLWLKVVSRSVVGAVLYNSAPAAHWTAVSLRPATNVAMFFPNMEYSSSNVSYLSLCNTDTMIAKVVVDFSFTNGASLTKEYALAGQTFMMIDCSDLIRSFPNVTPTDSFVATVSGSGRLSATAALYDLKYFRLAATESDSAEWKTMSAAFVTTVGSYSTILTLFNSSDKSQYCRAYIYGEAGDYVQDIVFTLEARQLLAKDIKEWFPLFSGSGLVTVYAPGVGVVGTRALSNRLGDKITRAIIALEEVPDPLLIGAYAQSARVDGLTVDQIVLKFNRPLNPQVVLSGDLARSFDVSNAHTWGSNASFTWARFNTELVITLGVGATVAPGDTVSSKETALDNFSRPLTGKALIGGFFAPIFAR